MAIEGLREPGGAGVAMRQLPLPIACGDAPDFERFVVGENTAALAALRRLAAGPAEATPLYLWGGPGLGKSHLLQALAGAWQGRGLTVGRLDAQGPLPAAWDPAWAALLIDHADRLDAPRQHAAFRLFVEAGGFGRPVVAAGRLPPVDLPLRDDLRSRLGWGLVFQLRPPGEAEARAALQAEARRRGLVLPEELLDWLLRRQARDLGHLMGLLDRLDAYALEHRRAITLPLLRAMLGGGADPPARGPLP